MAKDIQVDAELWEQFEHTAKEQRRNPLRLLSTVLREYIEIQADEKLWRELQKDARKSGYREGWSN